MAFNPIGDGVADQLSPNGKKSRIVSLKRQGGLLTSVELEAYKLLLRLSPTSQYLILPQVHLLQLFKIDLKLIDAELAKHRVLKAYREEIRTQISKNWEFEMGWKSIDFVVCAPDTTKVLGAIEIDDPTHNDPKRAACDLTKDVIFSSVGLPLLRFTNQQIWDLAGAPSSKLQSTFLEAVTLANKNWQATTSKL